MSIDLTLKMLLSATHLLGQLLEDSQEKPKLSGFTLTDGQRIIDGMLFKLEPTIDAPPPYAFENHHELAFEIGTNGLSLKHGKGSEEDSSHIPWTHPINKARIEAELAKLEELQDKREYDVVPSAPPADLVL